MQDLTFVVDRLEEINRELPKFGSTGFLEESAQKLSEIISTTALHVDLYLHSSATQEVREWLKRLTNSLGDEYLVSIKREEEDGVKAFGDIFSAIAIIPFDKTANNSAEFFLEKIKTEAKNYKLLLIINFSNINKCKQFATDFGISTSSIFLKEIESKNLGELLKTAVPKVDKLQTLQKISCLNSVKPLLISLDKTFVEENKTVQTRKMVYSQTLTLAQKGEQAVDLDDLLSSLNQQIRKAKKRAIEPLSAKYNAFNKLNEGKFAKFRTEKAKSFQRKHFEDEPTSEKHENTTVKIRKAYLDSLINTITDTLKSEFLDDTELLIRIIEDTLSLINTQLAAKGVQGVKLVDIIVPLPDEQKVIFNYAYINEQFTGDIIKKGSGEYINAIRENSKIIPMVIATSTGIVTNILKRNYVSTFITVAPVLYIFFDLKNNISKRRKNEFDLLLKNARGFIANEIERIYNESSKEWLKNIVSWTDEIEENINSGINKNIRQSNKKGKKMPNSEILEIDKVQENIDALQQSIKTAEGVKDGLDNEVKRLFSETEKELSQNIIIINEKRETITPSKNSLIWIVSLAFLIVFVIGFILYFQKNRTTKPTSIIKKPISAKPLSKENYQAAIDNSFAGKKYEEAKAKSLTLFDSNLHDQYIYGASVQHLGDTSIKGSSAQIFIKCAQAGDKDCQYETGMNAYKLANYDEALLWFNKSSDLGNSNSQVMLGTMYYNGKGVEPNLYKAFDWYLKSAEQCNEAAMCQLGVCYANGKGTAPDKRKAEQYFRWVVTNAKNMKNVEFALRELRKLSD